METTYKLAIVGGGPAGIGIFVRAARLGYLDQLLTDGVVLIHDGPIATLGRGKLGDYIINSNTFAKSLLGSVLDEKLELDPPESIEGTYLKSLSAHPSAQRLAQVGNASVSLIELGKFLEAVGYATRLEMMKYPKTSDCLTDTKATKIERTDKDLCKITTTRDGVESIFWAKNVVLAMGGTQQLPPPADLDPCYLSKTWTSDKVLCEPGRRELAAALSNAKDKKVCIIGGSHSSFSVAWVLLNKMHPKSKTDDAKPIQFNAKDITILHRGAIRCFYNTRKEAEADGVVVDKSDRAGNINTFTGLREDAKALFMAASTGHEPRVKLYQVKRGAPGAALRKQAFDGASAIIWCCGYTTKMIPIIDHSMDKAFSISRGAVRVDLKGQVIDNAGESLPWLFGVGIGFCLRAAVDEMKEETRADGVTVYHRRGATLVLAAVFGNCIYGKDCTSFEEMIEKCEKRRKEDKQHESKIPLTPSMSKKRISQPLTDEAHVQNQLIIAPRKSSLTARKESSPTKQNKNQTIDETKAIRRSSFELGRHTSLSHSIKAPKSCGKPMLAGSAQHAIRSIRTGVL
ncbi:hypothetical protein THRCLA_21762 [Thraustotheca clavata]|uniref:FAD/NAD(P)-binding domain-containing protein n=1 Tax=Thraustotheca clavata TaxID=74557 RepID=A0A1V9ZQ02_9STRA|nr:hypothetical protein THRCLA_21762 [Thraustotheca clavata]